MDPAALAAASDQLGAVKIVAPDPAANDPDEAANKAANPPGRSASDPGPATAQDDGPKP
jgi:hypothetical protein